MKKGVTLTELMIVVAIIGIIFVAIQPYFFTLRKTWHQSDSRSDMLQNARIGLDKMVRELRQAKGFASVTAASDINGRIVFLDRTDNVGEFKRYNDGTNNMLGYVQASVTSPLAGPIDSLKFTCYTDDGLTPTTSADAIKTVNIEMVVADPRSQISAMTFSSRAFVRKEAIATVSLVINEFMFNPLDSIPGNEDLFYEYVELYNVSGAPIDVAGWKLKDDGLSYDNILGDAVHGGTGTTIIPAGGYAIITDQDTKVYDVGSPYTVNPSAIKLQVHDDAIGNLLHNDQDSITIYNSAGTIIDTIVAYSDTWGVGGSDGNGCSLERISPTSSSNDPTNWEDSVLNGTPGGPN